MVPEEKETIENFKQRVREAMEAVPLWQFDKEKCSYKGSDLLTFSSTLFIIPALLCFANAKYLPFLGMLLTTLNSIRYHFDGSHHAKFVDVVSNFTFGALFTVQAMFERNWVTCIMSMCAVYGNILSKRLELSPDKLHAMLVHLPAFVGFLAIAIR